MTQFPRSVPPGVEATSPSPSKLNRQVLDENIARRRARLAELEAEMLADCEAAALGANQQSGLTFDRERWDRTAWHRYVAAAMRLEATFGPRMRRLRLEIGQLERLMSLSIAA
jgi:hypothetical protein